MAKRLQLVVNNNQSGPIPPSMKAIRVKDSKSAKRLLSRLIVQLQRGEVINENAKDLTYLLNSFISLMKYADEEKDIREYILRMFTLQAREVNILMDQFFQEVEAIIPEDKLKLYQEKFKGMSEKFEAGRMTRQKDILKQIARETSFKPKKQADETVEETKARVMNYLRSLSGETFDKVITEINKEYFTR